MKSKNFIVRKKAKLINSFLKDIKIKKIYKIFREKTFKHIGKKNFAIGVSGGSDSLCLAFLSKIYALEFNSENHCLIVDHKLRKESSSEASEVKKILKQKFISTRVLSWKGKKPESNIQLKAREIRYSLISKYCLKRKISFLLTAHHEDDQVENFFIRLFRGSGLTGLSSMQESTNYNKNLKIIRPLLTLNKKDLKLVTNKFFNKYIDDPSNENEYFLRVKVRKYIKKMNQEGFNTKKIIGSVNNLLIAKKAIDFYKSRALQKYSNFDSPHSCVINTKLFSEEANEIVFKSISDILSLVAGSYYPPRSRKILNLISKMRKTKFAKCTLGGCIIEKKNGFIYILKEAKNKKLTYRLSR